MDCSPAADLVWSRKRRNCLHTQDASTQRKACGQSSAPLAMQQADLQLWPSLCASPGSINSRLNKKKTSAEDGPLVIGQMHCHMVKPPLLLIQLSATRGDDDGAQRMTERSHRMTLPVRSNKIKRFWFWAQGSPSAAPRAQAPVDHAARLQFPLSALVPALASRPA